MPFTFEQISSVLNKIVQDVTGRNPAPGSFRNTKDFVTAATTVLSVGVDPIMNSISQLVGRTLMKVRPYDPAASLIDMDSLTYGNAVRMLTPIFVDSAENQPMFDSQPADGYSTDQWTIKRPKALETRYANYVQWEVQGPTVFEDQLRTAFTGPDQLGEFLAAQTTEVMNDMNSQKEALAHGTICNLIAGKFMRNSVDIKHVLTEYNTLTGETLTAQTVFAPANFPSFVKWLFAYIEDLSNLMTKRSVLFHEPLTGYTILRHTPKREQRLLMYSFILEAIKTMALSGIYNDNLLTMNVTAPVEYWMSMNDRMGIKVDCSYTAADGTIATGGVTAGGIIGVLFDRDAMGVNVNLESANATPMNAKGRYSNVFYHFARRYYSDVCENCVVFCLD